MFDWLISLLATFVKSEKKMIWLQWNFQDLQGKNLGCSHRGNKRGHQRQLPLGGTEGQEGR